MGDSEEKGLYRRGKNADLDKKYDRYKEMNVWAGNGLTALTEPEIDLMEEL